MLAGGRSSRMGSDKALALFGGRPLIQLAVANLAAAGIFARIAGSRSALGAFAPEIPDVLSDSGPMGGIHAALSASVAELNLFLPVDMPLMPALLLACLLERAMLTGAPVTASRLNGCLQPFPVVLRRTVLPEIHQCLAAGDTACYKAWQAIPKKVESELDAVAIESLIQCGQCRHPGGFPAFLWFQSANTPANLRRLNNLERLSHFSQVS